MADAPPRRKSPLIFMTVLAAGLLTAVYVVTRQDQEAYSLDEIFVEQVLVDPSMRPDFDFPEEIRSTNIDLNRFIDRFFRVCASAKYSEFRLLYTSDNAQEVSPERFESMFNVLRSARILALRKLPTPKGTDREEYLLVVEYDLENFAPTTKTRDNRAFLLIGKENDEWRFLGPRSREQLARYGEEILQSQRRPKSTTTQPATTS